ncbi:MAG: phosphomannomutase [Deltaproteobacteria bacterium RIFOXYA12_FULL_58_15]|nr:MAG: phosphomannomutase [Deltaproteobacteria bacterium RIFOXYA12_FULL_58_15]OGR07828.1 MAG: phosphomannomutase [Deltaproteobacteria bacterium RIFOXYB12_FULL_58_9]
MLRIDDLMDESNVRFGTSGARGLATDMTDLVCYAYTAGFLQHCENCGELHGSGPIAVAGDLRPSTGRIMAAVGKAVRDRGYDVENCGRVPSPAVAAYGLYGFEGAAPAIMVTGSHIPADRNGIKYNKATGEILKADEAGIREQKVRLPEIFDAAGGFCTDIDSDLPPVSHAAAKLYVNRYVQAFPRDCLAGLRLGVYGHSAVGRDLLAEIYEGLGAKVARIGWTEEFVAVDTEAIRPEDVAAAPKWVEEHCLDAVVSTDGDSDRPLVSDENGKWLRGDVAGVLVASFLGADGVAVPVSCNSVAEKCGLFAEVTRTRIGSPFVIEALQELERKGRRCVVGYEANGGFLLQTDVALGCGVLRSLPTRDAVLVHLGVLLAAKDKGKTVSALVAELPPRFTFSERLTRFPIAQSSAKIAELGTGTGEGNFAAIDALLAEEFGKAVATDQTDGLRITFASGEVVHFRPSGNAPELRCYSEADTEARAVEIATVCRGMMEGWR